MLQMSVLKKNKERNKENQNKSVFKTNQNNNQVANEWMKVKKIRKKKGDLIIL